MKVLILFKKDKHAIIVKYAQWYEIKYAITYFYNVYGYNEISKGKYATVIAKFLELKNNAKYLPITKPGNQKRRFTHVEDVINGLLLVGKELKVMITELDQIKTILF